MADKLQQFPCWMYLTLPTRLFQKPERNKDERTESFLMRHCFWSLQQVINSIYYMMALYPITCPAPALSSLSSFSSRLRAERCTSTVLSPLHTFSPLIFTKPTILLMRKSNLPQVSLVQSCRGRI